MAASSNYQSSAFAKVEDRGAGPAMDNLDDLVFAMLALAVAAVMLVAGELYLVTRADPPPAHTPPVPVVVS
jgi:hypothetical protein